MLLSNRLQNSPAPGSLNRLRLVATRTTSTVLSLAFVGSLAFTPFVSQARVPAAPSAAHNARLAKRLAQHKARLSEALALHNVRLVKQNQARLARVAKQNTREAAKHQKTMQRMAKLEQQHDALQSGNVVAAAYAFRGTRYVMGGTSRSGFDCSGFVRYILSNAGGVEMPRTAVEQYYNGTPIATKDLQPGDLVFFKNTYKHGISHVGIYAGEGKFIHAANAHKGVRMDNLSDSYYVAHFAGARRVLPAQMRASAFLR